MQLAIKFPRSLNEGHLWFLDFLKKLKLFKKVHDTPTRSTSILNGNSIRAIFCHAQSLIRNNWKPLFELNYSKNSTTTIRLLALDFYVVIIDSVFGLINDHLIEIENE